MERERKNFCHKDNTLLMHEAEMPSIYMDYQATTPVDPLVLEEMNWAWKNIFGNPSSNSHHYGWDAKKLVDAARVSISKVINSNPKDIIFTSGATESNNIAIKGVANFYKSEKKNHIVTMSTEHKCVIESCAAMARNGFGVTYIEPEKNGLLDLQKLRNAINEKTVLISICALHNEIGVIQDLESIGRIAKEKGVFFHTDAAQAFGKIEIDVDKMNIDLLSISGHKIYGPKGVGAIYVRRNPKVKIEPLFSGGGQERGVRSGTLPVPLIHGFGKAAEVAMERFEADDKHVAGLGKMLAEGLEKIPNVYLNGDREKRYLGNWNFSFEFVEGESLIMSIPNIAVSSGSACTSSTLEPSYVLRALGVREELAHSSIRFGIGRFTTEEEVSFVVRHVGLAVGKLREMSPLWEMAQEGVDVQSVKWNSH